MFPLTTPARAFLLVRLVLIGGLAVAPATSAKAATSRPPAPAVISAALQEELEGASDMTALVPLTVVATSDPTPFIRSIAGRIDGDIRGSIIAARVPAARFADLARRPGVVDLLASQHLEWSLDRSVPEIGADRVWSLHDRSGSPIRGTGVLVGIVDSGIDYRNADFRNPDGSTRIAYIWDQTQSGKPPSGFDFGYECDAASINSGACPETDTEGHGTHVAGIAAGNGLSSNPAEEVGVAPGATLMVVKIRATSNAVIAAWQYLVDKATQLHRPIVINNSFGSQAGPHDGSEAESRAIDALSGPGRIVVVAAGNEGNQGVHTSGTVVQGKNASVTVRTQGALHDLSFSVFYASSDELTATMSSPDGSETFGPVPFNQVMQEKYSPDRNTRVTIDTRPWDATHHSVLVTVERNPAASPLSGNWTLTLNGARVTDAGRFDAWLTRGTDGLQSFTNPVESDTLSYPADARSAISVGNYVTRVAWTDADGLQHSICSLMNCPGGRLEVGAIEPHSSSGPTADGRQKPDLAAPGSVIASSRSHDTPLCKTFSVEACVEPMLLSGNGQDVFELGTSMSAPHVAGTIALMLQADPDLNPARATTILRDTARHDGFTGSGAWSPQFGAGKLNALAATQAALAGAAAAVTPTPVPTATVRPAMTFTIRSVRLETDAGAPARAVVGRPVALATRVQVKNAVKGTRIAERWTVTRSGKTIGRHDVARTLTYSGNRTYRWAWTFTPRESGTFKLAVRVTAAGATKQKSISFTAMR